MEDNVNKKQGFVFAHYDFLNAKVRQEFHFNSSQDISLNIAVRTESGAISIEIEDERGNIIFSQSDAGTISHIINLSVDGDIVVILTADNHKGGFNVALI